MCELDAFRMAKSELKLRSDIKGLTPEIRGQTSVRWLFPLIE